MGQARHARSLPRNIGQLIGDLVSFTKPPRSPGV
jgi:hypothetical protein